MLPPSLVSVYQQYKEDTNAVASWLASTAKSRGYPADLLSGASSQETGPEHSKRLKGKARKQAKAAAQQAQASSSSTSSPDYIIAIKDFIPLAGFVAASKNPVVSVPLSFARTLNRVISTRSGFRSRLSDLGDSPDVSADSTHSYFVGVLEKVREVLTPRFSHATLDTTRPSSPADPVGEVGGRFAGLNVEEPTEEFLNAPYIDRPAPVKDDNATYVAEPLKEEGETMFTYFLMINDMNKIRDRVNWIWTSYRDGQLELVSAAIATNTACDLVRNLTEDMDHMFEALGGTMQAAKKFYLFQCMSKGFYRGSTPGSMIDLNDETYEIAKITYMIPIHCLEDFLENWNPGILPFVKAGIHDPYNPTRDWNAMSKKEEFKQDNILMEQFLCELAIIVRIVPNFPVYDEFIRGMQELDRTREIPMYLVFAAQMFLDVHHILRDKVYAACETCMSHLGLIQEDLALHMDLVAGLANKNWAAANDSVVSVLRRGIKYVKDDPIHEVRVKMYNEASMPCDVPIHYLLKLSPVISGLMLYHFRAPMYVLGLRVANSWSSITFSLHLLTALEQEKLLSPQRVPEERWEDLVTTAGLLGIDSFYVGSEAPKNPEEYMKKLALQIGVTAAAFSKNTHKRFLNPKSLSSKHGGRRIKENRAPVSDMFVDRYVNNTGQVDWTPDHVHNVLSRSEYGKVWFEEEGSTLRLTKMKKDDASEPAGRNKKAASGSRLPPDLLIVALALALDAESLTLVFPYLTLNRSTWCVLREIRDASEPLLSELYGTSPFGNEELLPALVSLAFSQLVSGDDRLFVRAGEVIKEQLRHGQGVKAIQRLQSMGYTVVHGPLEDDTPPRAGVFHLIPKGRGK